MPVTNPLRDPGRHLETLDGMPLISPTPWSQYQRPGAVTPQAASVIPEVAHSTVNAAGTSENVAMHVAVIVALAILGVWALRQSGFKFAVAGSLG